MLSTTMSGPGLAAPTDRENLQELWELSFGDPPAYIRNFRNFLAQDENTVVYRENGRAVSAVYLLDGVLHIGEETYSAYYFYAAATHPDFRRRGYMEKIIRYCRGLCEARNIDFLILVPAGNDLYQYYSRFGFRANFYLKTTELTREQLQGLADKLDPEPAEDILPGGTTDLYPVRTEALAGGSYLEFDAKTLQYMFFEHAYCGGKAILTEDGYVLYSRKTEDGGEEVLTVKELCSRGRTGALLRQLLNETADRYVLNLPAFDPIRGGKTSTGRAGMDLAVSDRAARAERTMKNAYIGLTLG